MKARILIIITSIVISSMALFIFNTPDVSAKYIEEPNCFGTLMFRSLKTQILHHYDLSYITCPNQDHWLAERPTGELACITERMAEKTGWYVHYENKVDMRTQAEICANGYVSFVYFEIT